MSANRFYLNQPFTVGEKVFLEDEEFHHLSRVMRIKEGDLVDLVNGKGGWAKAKTGKVEKRRVCLEILETQSISSSLPPLILLQAIPKLSHLELVIQKGTELGVTTFYLFASDRSEKKTLSSNQIKRLEQIAIGAMKQCDRFDLPSIILVPSLREISLPEGHRFFGNLTSQTSLPKGAHPYHIFIGPEKGFSQKDCEQLKELFQAKGVRLHPYTLRAETAAIVALTLATIK
jgi:16S rRNA (uracil1498-N3)-methyltransferase